MSPRGLTKQQPSFFDRFKKLDLRNGRRTIIPATSERARRAQRMGERRCQGSACS
jgi:hypothetical protein